jgi:hypothetical protein
MKYDELDQLDMGYNYFLLKNQIHLNLTYQKQYTYVHNNQMNPVMQHINYKQIKIFFYPLFIINLLSTIGIFFFDCFKYINF